MSIDKVQLQQQEVVNNEVVLTDINPITSTDSVFDPSSGSSMQEVIDRLWNSINSELSRIVNSVNNRTGAVVLSPGDVGLGNVDDVSFNDIKNWVIDYFSSKMAKYRFKLYDTYSEMVTEAATNERTLDSVPFYIKSTTPIDDPTGDKLAYIGYFYWNDTTSSINFNTKEINVVGSVDNSLNYDNGHLSVNIYPDEEALYVDNGEEDPTKTGLRIHPDKFASEMLSSPCMYGYTVSTSPNAPKGLLAAEEILVTPERTEVHIFIDDVEIPYQTRDEGGTTITIPHYLNKNWSNKLKMYTQIITEFKGYYSGGYDDLIAPTLNGDYDTLNLMGRQPAIGVVTHIPTNDDDPPYYEIKFTTIKSFTSGMGLKYVDNHEEAQNGQQLAVDMYNDVAGNGLSGLAAKAKGLLPANPSRKENSGQPSSDIQDLAYRPQAPYGASENLKFNGQINYHGLVVATDDTICRYPADKYNPSGELHNTGDFDEYIGSKYAENWSPIAYRGFKYDQEFTGDNQTPDGPDNGYLTSTSYLSVNMNKLVRNANYRILTDETAPDNWEIPSAEFYYVSAIGPDDNLYTKVEGTRKLDPSESGIHYEPGVFAIRTTETKYHFTDVSGLKSNHFSVDGTYPDNMGSRYSELTDSELKAIGIYDGKDSLGNEIELQPFNKVSSGLSVNVGNFLEICPKETSYGSNYNDSGKVNVRLGKGLMDDIVLDEKIDINVNIATNPPEGYYEHPENFRLMTIDGKLIEIHIGMYGIGTDNPDLMANWETEYINCYWKRRYDSDPSEYTYVSLKTESIAPTFYEGKYYYYGPMNWNSVITGISGTNLYSGIYRISRNNRIGVNVDNATIKIGEDNQLYSIMCTPFDHVHGIYKQDQIMYNIMVKQKDGVVEYRIPVLYHVNKDFVVNGQFDISEYVNDGYITELSCKPDNVTILANDKGFLSSVTKIKIFELDTKYTEDTILLTNEPGSHVLYKVTDLNGGFTSGHNIGTDGDPNYWLRQGNLSQLTFDPDRKTIDYVSDNGVKKLSTKATILREYSAGVNFYACEMFTNQAHTGVYMAKEDFPASGDISDDASRYIVIKAPS